MKLHLIPLEARLRVSEAAPNAGKNASGGRDPRLKVLLAAASDPVMVFASDGKLLDANPAAVEVMEAESVAEMRDRQLEDFIAAEDQSVAAQYAVKPLNDYSLPMRKKLAQIFSDLAAAHTQQ